MIDAIVFDAEPILAYLDDEPGSDTVETWIDRVASGEVDGYISPVTKTEILYVGSRIGFDERDVRASLTRLEELGVDVCDPTDCWVHAARLKASYRIPLGDAYALGTAESVDGTLLVGADDDFSSQRIDEAVIRFRDEPA
ncbi:type II toxin-antitoxin system VapC family toxin [Natrialbaceae archaeon A-CW3]